MSIKVGVCGTGSFANSFIPLFKAHPCVDEVILCDLDAKKLKQKSEKFGLSKTCPSLDELCQTDVDAIAIFSQHHIHGPQAIQALKSGKHVYSAVPSAIDMDDITALVRTVEGTGLVYMIGETSYYYPCAIYCRERFSKGDFGRIVYGEGEYYHDMDHGLREVLEWRHGPDWKRYASWPPFFYPTHSVSMIVSVTGAHVTHVSGMGVADSHDDKLFDQPDPVWKNRFSNEIMLCRMSDGSVARFNEFRRVGHPGTVGMSLYGTEGSYEEQCRGRVWVTKDGKQTEDLNELLACGDVKPEGNMAAVTGSDGTHKTASSVHPLHELPKEYIGLPNGHNGSHQFLIHEFVTSCVDKKTPRNNVWQAARYLIPGLMAHESAMNGGVLMEVPDLGGGPL